MNNDNNSTSKKSKGSDDNTIKSRIINIKNLIYLCNKLKEITINYYTVK